MAQGVAEAVAHQPAQADLALQLARHRLQLEVPEHPGHAEKGGGAERKRRRETKELDDVAAQHRTDHASHVEAHGAQAHGAGQLHGRHEIGHQGQAHGCVAAAEHAEGQRQQEKRGGRH